MALPSLTRLSKRTMRTRMCSDDEYDEVAPLAGGAAPAAQDQEWTGAIGFAVQEFLKHHLYHQFEIMFDNEADATRWRVLHQQKQQADYDASDASRFRDNRGISAELHEAVTFIKDEARVALFNEGEELMTLTFGVLEGKFDNIARGAAVMIHDYAQTLKRGCYTDAVKTAVQARYRAELQALARPTVAERNDSGVV